jgi:2-polyprenyl-6-methoxyphenol hydroxylase-like FAD-dependent oxidoreductase
MLENGRTVHGDILIGADGIWSQVRTTTLSNERVHKTPLKTHAQSSYSAVKFPVCSSDKHLEEIFAASRKHFVLLCCRDHTHIASIMCSIDSGTAAAHLLSVCTQLLTAGACTDVE